MADPLPDKPVAQSVYSRVAQTILDVVAHIPETDEPKSRTPRQQARQIAFAGAAKAGLAAGTLALPPGLAGMFTVIPQLIAVWRIQIKMVADIAAVYGQSAKLTREQMLYCLFKATAAQAVGRLVVTVGESVLIRRPTLRVLESIAEKVGMKVTQTLLGGGIARWLPFVGALGVGAYTYCETGRVAQTAIDLFEKPIEVESSVTAIALEPGPRRAKKRRTRKGTPKIPGTKKQNRPVRKRSSPS